MKKTTISQMVRKILDMTYTRTELIHEDVREATFKRLANEVAIIGKALYLIEKNGIESGMGYYDSTHHEEEYLEFLEPTEEVSDRLYDPEDISLCEDGCGCMTHSVLTLDGIIICAKCGAIKGRVEEIKK